MWCTHSFTGTNFECMSASAVRRRRRQLPNDFIVVVAVVVVLMCAAVLDRACSAGSWEFCCRSAAQVGLLLCVYWRALTACGGFYRPANASDVGDLLIIYSAQDGFIVGCETTTIPRVDRLIVSPGGKRLQQQRHSCIVRQNPALCGGRGGRCCCGSCCAAAQCRLVDQGACNENGPLLGIFSGSCPLLLKSPQSFFMVVLDFFQRLRTFHPLSHITKPSYF